MKPVAVPVLGDRVELHQVAVEGVRLQDDHRLGPVHEVLRLDEGDAPVERGRPAGDLVAPGDRVVQDLVVAVAAHAPLVPLGARDDLPGNAVRRGVQPAGDVVVPDVSDDLDRRQLVALLRVGVEGVVRGLAGQRRVGIEADGVADRFVEAVLLRETEVGLAPVDAVVAFGVAEDGVEVRPRNHEGARFLVPHLEEAGLRIPEVVGIYRGLPGQLLSVFHRAFERELGVEQLGVAEPPRDVALGIEHPVVEKQDRPSQFAASFRFSRQGKGSAAGMPQSRLRPCRRLAPVL